MATPRPLSSPAFACPCRRCPNRTHPVSHQASKLELNLKINFS